MIGSVTKENLEAKNMKAKYSFVCDAANISQSGNINVLGIFRNINVSTFPCTLSKMTYVACIEFHRSEVGRHKFKLTFINDDGKDILPSLNGEIEITSQSLITNIILDISNVVFTSPGNYAIDLTVNNQNIASEDILINHVN